MNCLEFRRHKLADPRRLPPEATAHVDACAHCHDFAAEVDRNEERLAAVLAVAVPEGLAERIILNRKMRQRGWPRYAPRLLALAAAVVLTLGIGFSWWGGFASGEYAREAIKHVMHEPESFTTARIADQEVFRKVMHEFGADLQAPIGRVRYMKLCPVPGGTGWHIVFETEHGLATLILVPGKSMKVHQAEATLGGWNALAQSGGQGYYAIVTASPDSLEAVSRMLRQRVRWRG
jgi:hypothetical protein